MNNPNWRHTENRGFGIPPMIKLMTCALAALALTGCVSDFRRDNITTPSYRNPLENLQPIDTSTPVPGDVEDVSAAVSQPIPSEFRYVTALSGDTAQSIAERNGVDPLIVAELNGVFPDSVLEENRILRIPNTAGTLSAGELSEISASALDGTAGDTGASTGAATVEQSDLHADVIKFIEEINTIPAPPIANDPLPADVEDEKLPASPQFSQYQTDETTTRFLMPVQGEIIRGYSADSDGIDIAAPEGSPVLAANDGSVVHISRLNDDTAIILIAHSDGVYTVYWNVTDLSVAKSTGVSRGDTLGKVAGGNKEFLRFEVRIGSKGTDPLPYIS